MPEGFPDIEQLSLVVSGAAFVASLVGLAIALWARRQARTSILLSFTNDLRAWSIEVRRTLSDAIHLCDLDPQRTDDPSFFNRRHSCRLRVSSHIDEARFFFENRERGAYGVDKPWAYRGLAPKIVEHLSEAYVCLGKLDFASKSNHEQMRSRLVGIVRDFVSELQMVLQPDRLLADIKKMGTESRPPG